MIFHAFTRGGSFKAPLSSFISVMIETSLRHEEKRPTAGVEGRIFPVDLFGVASALSLSSGSSQSVKIWELWARGSKMEMWFFLQTGQVIATWLQKNGRFWRSPEFFFLKWIIWFLAFNWQGVAKVSTSVLRKCQSVWWIRLNTLEHWNCKQ